MADERNPNRLVTIPVSAIIPTKDRAFVLKRTLMSLSDQLLLPKELIIIDGSTDDQTRKVVSDWESTVACETLVIFKNAKLLGAAAQRNQGTELATQPFLWFFDDDIIFQQNCVARLWEAIKNNHALGGVSAMITNQHYLPPRFISRSIFVFLNGSSLTSFAGKVIGPAVHILPEDKEELPEVVPTQWLNLGCTIYRREALPVPTFDSVFTGYSMMEDLVLSLRVSEHWCLANVRTARIYHDSQPGDYKSDHKQLARMELVNRHYVMTEVLGRNSIYDYFKLALWEVFQIVSTRNKVLDRIQGKLLGVCEIWKK